MLIAPSVLSLNYDNFKNEVEALNRSCDWLHFDVMDGHFVPNLTFGPDILRQFKRNSSLFADVHLMVDIPEFFIDLFANAGADAITFHYEVFNDIKECERLLDKIHGYYIKAGIAIRPATKVEDIYPLLDKCDIVLIMSVEPGFGGQKFQPMALEKIEKLYKYRQEHNLNFYIEDDGGINDKTAFDVVQKGCDVLIAGSYLFKGDIENNVELLRKCAK